jgi:multiple sugar transport system permease protein
MLCSECAAEHNSQYQHESLHSGHVMRTTNTFKQLGRNRSITGYLFILPNFIGFLVFTIIPIFFAISISFTRWDSMHPPRFVGIKNFVIMVQDSSFLITLLNTLTFTFGSLPFAVVLALVFAIILNQGVKGKNIFRAVFFFPYIASVVACAITWQLLFHPGAGPINSILKMVGIGTPPRWLASRDTAMISVIIVYVWQVAGYYMVMFLAGLQTIPDSLYESAEIDGATYLRKLFSITIPMLSPTFFLVIIIFIINSFKVFSLIYIMTDGGPGRATSVLVFYIYNQAFELSRYGYASAMSLVLFIIMLTVTIIQYRGQKRWVTYME